MSCVQDKHFTKEGLICLPIITLLEDPTSDGDGSVEYLMKPWESVGF